MPNCANCYSPSTESTRCATCAAPLHTECAVTRGGFPYCDAHVAEEKPQIVLPESIRRSYIELYKKCPYSFYLQVVKGLEQPATVYTQLGIDLHVLMDNASWNKDFTAAHMKSAFHDMFEAYPSSFFTDAEFKWKMWTRAVESIDAFYVLLPTFPVIPYATEQKIEFHIGENLPTANITMDRIDLIDGMLDISDYKTGKVIVGQKISTDLQPPLYIRAVRDHFGVPVRRFRLLYLQEGKERVYERVDDENYVCTVRKREYHINLTDAVKEVQRIFQHIKNGQFNIPTDTKAMYFTCKMCHFKENGTCRGAEEEIWYQK